MRRSFESLSLCVVLEWVRGSFMSRVRIHLTNFSYSSPFITIYIIFTNKILINLPDLLKIASIQDLQSPPVSYLLNVFLSVCSFTLEISSSTPSKKSCCNLVWFCHDFIVVGSCSLLYIRYFFLRRLNDAHTQETTAERHNNLEIVFW